MNTPLVRAPLLLLAVAACSYAVHLSALAQRSPGSGRITTQLGGAQPPRDESFLPYRPLLEVQHHLRKSMPAEPPRVDAWYRASFPGMSEAERDAYVPADNALTLVSRSTTVNIPMRRGAYFALPELQDAYDEKAKLLIGGERTVWVGVWWTLRVPDSRQVSYGDIVSARAQIAAVQNRISNYSPPMLKAVKRNPYDGIKACFHGDDGGAILVNGEARADAVDGSCKVLFSDSRIANDATIAFAGPVTAVSFIDRRFYTRSN